MDPIHIPDQAGDNKLLDWFEAAGISYPAYLRQAHSILRRNWADAEDEVQNAFYRALLRQDQFRGEGNRRAWLWRIVKTECLMRLRQSNREPLGCDPAFLAQRARDLRTPESILYAKERKRILRRGIACLPKPARVALAMHLDGRPATALASALNLKVSTAKARLSRSRQALRQRIEGLGYAGKSLLTD